MNLGLFIFLLVFNSYITRTDGIREACTKLGFACTFPFTYAGETYNHCIETEQGNWCGIQANVTRKKHGLNFDYCVPECTISPDMLCTKGGQKCVLPIQYKGQSYTRCIPPNKKHKAQWCYGAADKSQEGLCTNCPKKHTESSKTTPNEPIPMKPELSTTTGLLNSKQTSSATTEPSRLQTNKATTNWSSYASTSDTVLRETTEDMIPPADHSPVVLGVTLGVGAVMLIITGVVFYTRRIRSANARADTNEILLKFNNNASRDRSTVTV